MTDQDASLNLTKTIEPFAEIARSLGFSISSGTISCTFNARVDEDESDDEVKIIKVVNGKGKMQPTANEVKPNVEKYKEKESFSSPRMVRHSQKGRFRSTREQRKWAIDKIKRGYSKSKIAEKLGFTSQTVAIWWRNHRKEEEKKKQLCWQWQPTESTSILKVAPKEVDQCGEEIHEMNALTKQLTKCTIENEENANFVHDETDWLLMLHPNLTYEEAQHLIQGSNNDINMALLKIPEHQEPQEKERKFPIPELKLKQD